MNLAAWHAHASSFDINSVDLSLPSDEVLLNTDWDADKSQAAKYKLETRKLGNQLKSPVPKSPRSHQVDRFIKWKLEKECPYPPNHLKASDQGLYNSVYNRVKKNRGKVKKELMKMFNQRFHTAQQLDPIANAILEQEFRIHTQDRDYDRQVSDDRSANRLKLYQELRSPPQRMQVSVPTPSLAIETAVPAPSNAASVPARANASVASTAFETAVEDLEELSNADSVVPQSLNINVPTKKAPPILPDTNGPPRRSFLNLPRNSPSRSECYQRALEEVQQWERDMGFSLPTSL